MDLGSYVASSIKQQGECGICLEQFNNFDKIPKILPCFPLHIICSDCIVQFYNYSAPIDECIYKDKTQNQCQSTNIHYRCPFDRIVFHLPQNGINDLPTFGVETFSYEVAKKRWTLQNQICAQLDELRNCRDEAAAQCQLLIKEINVHNRNCAISRIAGSSTGIVGCILFVVGAALTPVTFGASASLMIAGTVIGTAGGVTASGGSIAELVLNNVTKKKVEMALLICRTKQLEIQTLCNDLAICNDIYDAIAHELSKDLNIGTAEIGSLASLVGMARLTTGVIDMSTDVSLTILKSVGITVGKSAVRVLGMAINLIILPLDIASIVVNSIDVHTEKPTVFVQKLEKHMEDVKANVNNFINAVNNFVDKANAGIDKDQLLSFKNEDEQIVNLAI